MVVVALVFALLIKLLLSKGVREATGELRLQDIGVFLPDIVEVVPPAARS